jgi:hypothetical protein
LERERRKAPAVRFEMQGGFSDHFRKPALIPTCVAVVGMQAAWASVTAGLSSKDDAYKAGMARVQRTPLSEATRVFQEGIRPPPRVLCS